MRKVCNDWVKEAFDDQWVRPDFWEDFKANAERASAEIHCVANMEEASKELQAIAKELGAQNVVAVGNEENADVAKAYEDLRAAGLTVYTDKFDIAANAPMADLGVSCAEFGVGETGSVCVDTYSFEARVVGMLPPAHVVFLNANYLVENVETAFEVISKVFKSGYMGFVTGPSRTADIERVLSLGVHGPSRFFIIAVGGKGMA